MSLLSTRPFLNSLRSLSPKSSFFNPRPRPRQKKKNYVVRFRPAEPDALTAAPKLKPVARKISVACNFCRCMYAPFYFRFRRGDGGSARLAVARRALPPCLPRPQLVEQLLISFLARKLKCDGGKPQCQQCIRRKVVCEYDTNVKRRGLARSTQNPEDAQGIDVRERPLVNPKAVACQFCRSKPTLAFSRYTSTTLLMISNHPLVALSPVLASRSQDKM